MMLLNALQFRNTRVWILWTCALACGAAWAAVPATWKDAGPFAWHGGAAPVNRVLSEFARSHGATLVSQLPHSATVSGRVQAASPEVFLDRLALDHQFNWFFFNQRLYVSPKSDHRTERISVRDMGTAEVKQALVGIGLFESKFGWGELQDDNTVLVSGPTEYVRQVRQVLGADSDGDAGDAMVFRIQHAFLDDREISVRGTSVRIPGLVSILRNLVRDGRQAATQRTTPPAGITLGSRGLRDESFGSGVRDVSSASASPSSNKRETPPTIEADLRTNVLIVRDAPHRRGFYRQLLSQLDVPQQMVEIEALIIDVERVKLVELGIDWAATFGGGTGRTNVTVNNLTAAVAGSPGTLLIDNLARFLAQVRALESDGYAAIAAKPVVMTMANLSAVIDLSRTVYIRLVGERAVDAVPVTAGTLLKVTPQIQTDAGATQVALRIDIEDGVITDNTAGGTPSVERSNVTTQLAVADRQSLIVASFNRQSDERGRSAVPGLGRLPLLGGLFRSNRDDLRARERLFVITPRVVDPLAAYARAAGRAETFRESQRNLAPMQTEAPAPAQGQPQMRPEGDMMP
jgi:type III secretion protein C